APSRLAPRPTANPIAAEGSPSSLLRLSSGLSDRRSPPRAHVAPASGWCRHCGLRGTRRCLVRPLGSRRSDSPGQDLGGSRSSSDLSVLTAPGNFPPASSVQRVGPIVEPRSVRDDPVSHRKERARMTWTIRVAVFLLCFGLTPTRGSSVAAAGSAGAVYTATNAPDGNVV